MNMKILENHYSSEAVSEYYNRYIPMVVDSMSVDLTMQSCRTTNIIELHKYIAEIIELSDNMELLDAGCGIGGPSIYMAKNYRINVEAWTNSQFMRDYFNVQVNDHEKNSLKGNINLTLGDYHDVLAHYGAERFDRIMFLESFLHSYNPAEFLKELYQVLKPGGILYLKEIILDEYPFWAIRKRKICNAAYLAAKEHFKYNYAKLSTLQFWIKDAGFVLELCRKPQIKVDESPGDYYLNEIGQIPELSRCQGFTWSSCYEFKCIKK